MPSNVKPTFFKDRLLSFSHQRPQKKSKIFVFETKGTFVLSFLSVSGSGSTLPDPDPLVRGMYPDPDPNPSMRLLQKSEYTTLSRPQQHSHSREKVRVNSLLQAN